VQERVWGETVDMYYGVPEEERLPPPASTDVAPSITVYEAPKHDDSGHEQPAASQTIPSFTLQEPTPEPEEEKPLPQPTYHEHKPETQVFQAPEMEWDATRSAPPPKSRPEAEHFPTHHYTFEQEQKAFRPPPAYAPPPRDMWYQVPEQKAQAEMPPQPIFPWEQRSVRSRATRIFAEDLPATPPQERSFVGSPPNSTWQENSGGMEQYLRKIFSSQRSREKELEGKPETTTRGERRESMVIIGMPAEHDRPSLPVTPAPIMTSSFWGEDEDDGVGAKGGSPVEGEERGKVVVVPEQAEWVCPHCGFASGDVIAFLRVPAASGSIKMYLPPEDVDSSDSKRERLPESLETGEHQKYKHSHYDKEHGHEHEHGSQESEEELEAEMSTKLPAPEFAFSPKTGGKSYDISLAPITSPTTEPEDDDIPPVTWLPPPPVKTLPTRPAVLQRESSGADTAMSGASTIVSGEKISSPTSKKLPVDKLKTQAPPPKASLLPPPAWLTAALGDDNPEILGIDAEFVDELDEAGLEFELDNQPDPVDTSLTIPEPTTLLI
jgi:hypothetical protein